MQYTDIGTLVVKTYTAGEAMPVANSVIRILGTDAENRFAEYSYLTNRDGVTEKIFRPTRRIRRAGQTRRNINGKGNL
jgi:hypothetical protein